MPDNQHDPNSSIQLSYLATSFDFRVRFIASSKSCEVTGRSTSSRFISFISAGDLPTIRRRIDIIDASLCEIRGKCVEFRNGLKTMNERTYRHTLVISEPVKPLSFSATQFRSKSGAMLTPFRHSFSKAARVSSSGSPIKTRFSKRRLNASSMSHGWFVAARTIIIFSSLLDLKHSILNSN